MTLDEIAYNILNLVRGGRSSHDDYISLDQIKFNIRHYRAMFIRRDFARNGTITRHLEQDLGCLELEQVDASKCCNLPSECIVYRTKKKLPRTVRFNLKEAITYTGSTTGLGRIPMVESYEIEYIPYDKYTANKPKTYMIEDYLYLYNPGGMDTINVRGIFENPEEVEKFGTCDGPCYDSKFTYPLPADMVSAITAGLINGELKLLSASLNDDEADRQQDKQ